MFKEGVTALRAWLLEALFPQNCLGCATPGFLLCTNCWHNNPEFTQATGVFRCPICQQNNQDGKPCSGCQNSSALSQIIALTEYNHTRASGKLLENLKYRYSPEAVRLVQTWVKTNLAILQKLPQFDVIIPVPLHPRRAAERGFNQAEIIASAMASALNKPIFIDVLVRTRATEQQAKLVRAERKANVYGAFACTKTDQIKNQVCLLVDDVFTTGNTLQEVARVARASGATDVVAFALYRPPFVV